MSKKIRIIDLIKRLYDANDYDLPFHIKYQDKIFELDENMDYTFNDEFSIMSYLKNMDCLNDEVEILDEEELDELEELQRLESFDLTKYSKDDDDLGLELNYTGVSNTFNDVYFKINEMIKHIKKLESESNNE